MSHYIIYRDNNYNIVKYSIISYTPDIEDRIREFNKKDGQFAELALNRDLISLIDLAEDQKRYTQDHVDSILNKFDMVENTAFLFRDELNNDSEVTKNLEWIKDYIANYCVFAAPTANTQSVNPEKVLVEKINETLKKIKR